LGKTETISSKVRNETRMPTLSTLFNIVLEFLARSITQEEEIKGIQMGKEEVKLSLSADDMILYLRNSTKKLLDTINSSSKVTGYKINLQKSVAFLYTNNEQIEKKIIGKQFHLFLFYHLFYFILLLIYIILFIFQKKYIRINLTKDVNDFYKENKKTTEERNQRRLQKMERSPILMVWQNQSKNGCSCLIKGDA
jgi:hypothetical protein